MLAMKSGGFLLPFSVYSPRFLGSERYKEGLGAGLAAGLGHEDLALRMVWQKIPQRALAWSLRLHSKLLLIFSPALQPCSSFVLPPLDFLNPTVTGAFVMVTAETGVLFRN